MNQKTLTTWIMATRPQFFTVIILPILLGTAIAWHLQGVFLPLYFGLSLVAGIFTHAGINVLNDYFDHLNGADDFNQTPLSPFAGGSRMIQKGILTAAETYRYGLLLLSIAVGIGLFLVWARGLPLLWIGLIGVLCGYFYSAPPFSFHSRGLGEMLVGLNFGVLAVLGAFYVQTQTLSLTAVIAALPLACLVAAILYINEFPDYAADFKVGKNTLVVRLGQVSARHIYVLLIGLSFISVVLGVMYKSLPLLSLVSLLALPLGFFAVKTLYAFYEKPTALIPAIKNTIMLHTLVSVLLIL
ncbi:MAG TPA: 1,4-dihydroxy-2-naphthoate octaprenyltransferase, partial [Thioploca sp.]|nr:1,4-dihydroxy-2-naphthoate octaprenyltransferase [Thioploca sp.]